jgi:hypothetical protein
MKPTMCKVRIDRDGFAAATTLMIILVLTVMAVAAAWLATSEKRTSFAEGVHVSAVFAADAGGEAAINFLRGQEVPPPIIQFPALTVQSQGNTVVNGSQAFAYDCNYLRKRPKPGWGLEFLDYEYGVVSQGEASQDGQSAVQLVAARLFKEGYH